MIITAEISKSVQFVGREKGKPTAVLVDIGTWQTIIEILEDIEDQSVFQMYATRRLKAKSPEEMGLIPWEDVETELEALETANHASLD